MNKLSFPLRTIPLLLGLTLVACGGGSDGSSSNDPPDPVATLTGTAVIGAALSGGVVQVLDRTGNTVCSNAPVATSSSGVYACELTKSSQAPMVLVISDPQGLFAPLVSLVASKPAPGASSTVNATPLTTAIATQMDPSAEAKSAQSFVRSPAILASLDLSALEIVKTNLVTQLAGVLTSLKIPVGSFDPVSTPIEAGADGVLEQVRVTFDANGAPQLSNILNPAVAPVSMAGTSTASISPVTVSAIVTTPGETPTFRLAELDILKEELERCFAVPAATRAPGADFVNRRLSDTQDVAQECGSFAASAGDPEAVDIDFLHNGYRGNSYFFGLLTSPSMDNARFTPELTRLILRGDGRHEAVLNIKFVDGTAARTPGNRLLVAKKFPGSREEGQSQWWLVGNQRPLDAFVRTSVTQREQVIPSAILDSDPRFSNAFRSRVEVGLQIFVHRPNNGTTVNNPNNPNNTVRFVRVRGPGLPAAGLVYADVVASDGRTSMSILNTTGVIPTSPQLTNNVGDVFRMERTRGIGSTATLRGNPSVDVANILSPNWAHPTMYGQAPSSDWRADISGMVAWASYTFEAFCASATTPCYTFAAPLGNDLPSATLGARLPWANLTPASLAGLSGGAVATNSLNVAWMAPANAERITTAYVQGFTPSSFVDGFASVPSGSTAQNVTANGNSAFPAISMSSNQASRAIRLQYGMLDGTSKEQWVQFN